MAQPQVKIEVGKPIRMEKDNSGPAYHVYPVRVTAEGKGVTRTTLSVNGSGVHEAAGRVLNYQLSERDFKAGSHALFASATDGNETGIREDTLAVAQAPAEAPKASAPQGTGTPTATQK